MNHGTKHASVSKNTIKFNININIFLLSLLVCFYFLWFDFYLIITQVL